MIRPTDPPDLRTLIRMGTYLICWAISEIPRLSHTAPEQHSSRYSVHAGTLQGDNGIFCILVANMGRFPELTPVRSQTMEPWFATLEAGYTVDIPNAPFHLLLLYHTTPDLVPICLVVDRPLWTSSVYIRRPPP